MKSSENLKHIIALPLLTEVGNKRAKEMIDFFGSATDAFNAGKEELSKIPNIGQTTINAILSSKASALRRADEEMLFVDKHGIRCYSLYDEDYPARLRECPDAPLLLYTKGNVDFSATHFVSVVGTRMPTDRGKERCRQIVLDLAGQVSDLCIVSGLAYGIDVTAHKAAIEANIPTLIIPGHGLDRIYPYANRQVAIEALENGGIVTEFMSKTTPERTNFIARNRIIAGLADVVVVVESKIKGGSLITAEMAWAYDRDIFTFPGRPEDEASQGCNKLIKQQKAALIENADDLIAAMRWETHEKSQPMQTSLFEELGEKETFILNLLRQEEDGMHINRLAVEAKMSFSELTANLFQLELSRHIKALPGGIYRAL